MADREGGLEQEAVYGPARRPNLRLEPTAPPLASPATRAAEPPAVMLPAAEMRGLEGRSGTTQAHRAPAPGHGRGMVAPKGIVSAAVFARRPGCPQHNCSMKLTSTPCCRFAPPGSGLAEGHYLYRWLAAYLASVRPPPSSRSRKKYQRRDSQGKPSPQRLRCALPRSTTSHEIDA